MEINIVMFTTSFIDGISMNKDILIIHVIEQVIHRIKNMGT